RMDARPLPLRPNLEQYKKQAKELLKAAKSSDPSAIRAWTSRWVESWSAQWMEMRARLEGTGVTSEIRARLDRETDRIARGIQSELAKPKVALADAQFYVARAHGFASWPKFAKHIQESARQNSTASKFEAAVDAILNGDAPTLRRLLRANPELIRARSNRAHRSTLLHYVSANGVEDYRQKTPPNIVEITKVLLAAGAELDAESEAYGGSD